MTSMLMCRCSSAILLGEAVGRGDHLSAKSNSITAFRFSRTLLSTRGAICRIDHPICDIEITDDEGERFHDRHVGHALVRLNVSRMIMGVTPIRISMMFDT
jgi:hypothetical protein